MAAAAVMAVVDAVEIPAAAAGKIPNAISISRDARSDLVSDGHFLQ